MKKRKIKKTCQESKTKISTKTQKKKMITAKTKMNQMMMTLILLTLGKHFLKKVSKNIIILILTKNIIIKSVSAKKKPENFKKANSIKVHALIQA